MTSDDSPVPDGSPASDDSPESPEMTVDARGRRCPLPVIDLANAVRDAPVGTLVEVLADDPAAATDIPAWCRMRNQTFVGSRPGDGGATAYSVRVR